MCDLLQKYLFFCRFLSFKYIFCSVLIVNSMIFFSQNNESIANNETQAVFRVRAEVVNGDTFPLVDLGTIYVFTDYIYKNKKDYEQWTKIKFNVKKVYPYAILASAKLKEYDRVLSKIKSPKEQKIFMKVYEKDLRNEFEEELKQLSISQGKILMKLIDRESGKTTYDIVKQLRGGFQAIMWQSIALVFGHNMKAEYDPNLEDLMIERAIKIVEAGQF